jgi:hypothetical protein
MGILLGALLDLEPIPITHTIHRSLWGCQGEIEKSRQKWNRFHFCLDLLTFCDVKEIGLRFCMALNLQGVDAYKEAFALKH